MRFKSGIIGDIKKDLKKFGLKAERSVKQGAVKTERGLKSNLRQQIVAAGMGQKLANTWRGKVYPKGTNSMNSAVSVYSKAPHIIEAFDRGVLIRAKNRRFLAIPTEFAPKYAGRGPGRKMTPANFTKKTGIKLYFIDRGPGKNPLLVTKGTRVTKSGAVRSLTVRKATKTMGARTNLKGQAWVPMFVLVPQVKFNKRIDVAKVLPKWQAFFVAEIDKGMSRNAN